MSHPKRTLDEWMDLIQECRTSGLPDAQWCEENGIALSTFYLKIKKLRQSACTVPEPLKKQRTTIRQEIVPLQIIDGTGEPACQTAADFSALGGNAPAGATPVRTEALAETLSPAAFHLDWQGIRIGISGHASPEAIRSLLLAVRSVC